MKKEMHLSMIKSFSLSIIFISAISLFAQTIDDGLVAHWTFDEIKGNVVKDVVGGFDGAVHGGCAITKGRIGNAIEFNASDGFIDLKPPKEIANLKSGTLTFWYYCNEISTGHGEIEPMFYYGKNGPYASGLDACNGGFVVELGHGNVLPSEWSQGRFWTFFTGGDGSTANGAGNPNPTM